MARGRFPWRLGWLSACLLALASARVAPAKDATKENDRLLLIRGLAHEIAVSKVPLPRGKKGIVLDSQGHLDQAEASTELRENGVAISPGMPTEITKITFKPKAIVLDINGGGKKRSKWYQHIEIGMGAATQPIAPQTPVVANGSFVTIRFPDKVPDLTADQAKQILSSVLDFERHSPTVLYSPSVPPKFKEAIKKHEVLVGMDRDAVLSAKGPPERKVREVKEGSEKEDWIYGLPPHVLIVTFDGDTVVAVKQY
jgi:hypothetical protein